MEVDFSTDSLLIAAAVLILVTIIPVKISAGFFGASNNSIGACVIAVVLGTVSAVAALNMFNGFSALILAFVAVSIVYWLILKTSFFASFGLTILVVLTQFGVIQALGNLGVVSIV